MLERRWHFIDFAQYDKKIIDAIGFDCSFFRATPKQYLNTWDIYDVDYGHEFKEIEVTFGVDDILEAETIAFDFRNATTNRIRVSSMGSSVTHNVDAKFDNATWREYSRGIKLTIKFICSVMSTSFSIQRVNLGDSFTIDTGETVGNYRIYLNLDSNSSTLSKIHFHVGHFDFTWNTSLMAGEQFIFDTKDMKNSGIKNSSGSMRKALIDYPTEFTVKNPESMLVPYKPGSNFVVEFDNLGNPSCTGRVNFQIGVLVV